MTSSSRLLYICMAGRELESRLRLLGLLRSHKAMIRARLGIDFAFGKVLTRVVQQLSCRYLNVESLDSETMRARSSYKGGYCGGIGTVSVEVRHRRSEDR